MNSQADIPSDLKRFILTSIASVPHLEAILLMRSVPNVEWNASMMAQRLYISEKKAGEILADLSDSGFASVREEENVRRYSYSPVSGELKEMVDQLAEVYAKHLIEVTKLIHSKMDKQAQRFGDAFKWHKKGD